MRFKPRMPLTSSRLSDKPDPENVQPAEASTVPDTSEANACMDGDPMTGAFEAVAMVVREEMKSLRQELISRIDGAIAGLREQALKAREQSERRSDEVKKSLEKILSNREQSLKGELRALSTELAGLQAGLEKQTATSGQVSQLLNNMAGVFKDPRALPPDSAK